MDLTDADVTDILALLDSLPYDELDLETPRFRLTLRRTPHGWTQSTQVMSAPAPLAPAPPPRPDGDTAGADAEVGTSEVRPGEDSAPPAAQTTASMSHRGGNNRTDVTSLRPGAEADGDTKAEGENGADGVSGGASGAAGWAEEGDGGLRAEEGDGGLRAEEEDGGLRAEEGDGGLGIAEPELVAVRAPLPGTFYRAPRPGAAPFVEVGSRVSADTVIGIVETMKLMNSVHAGVAGRVAEFCVPNAEFAAHGATLLRIRADT
jgi:biotin carboxyl carrier protein